MKEIEKIIEAYDNTDWSIEKAAIGTVVKVEESAYRRVGARMYVSSLGHWVGGISGGCLEGDALKRAQIAIYSGESSIVVYDTTEDDSHQIGVGLGCNGRIEVMFTPIQHDDPNNPITFLKGITSTRETEVVLQVLSNSDPDSELLGSFYPSSKFKDLAARVDIPYNTLMTCIDTAKHKRKSKVFQLENGKEYRYDILVELIQPKVKLICVGDNYDVSAIVKITHELGWEIHIYGHARKLNPEVFQYVTSVNTYEQVADIDIDAHTAVVLMSHDYKKDLTALRHLIHLDLTYIGMLGPKNRLLKMQKELSDQGLSVDLLEKTNLYSPVGLDIGAQTPEEISLAIAAEIVATLRSRQGEHLRKRQGPIHDRD